MIILAIETTTSVESLALVTEGKILAEINLDNGLSHSARLVKNVDYLFKSAGLSISDVSAVAVSSGPGSFTGLRVGFSLAKGLAYAAKKYFLAVPTLDAFAFSVCRLTGGVAGKKIKNGVETLALTLEGGGNDLVVCTRCFCCSQVFIVLYCKYQCRNALVFV